MDQKEFNAALQKHLMKCELEYRAKMLPNGCCVDWLSPFCGSTAEIAMFLRDLGFRIREIVDEEPWPGERHQWVRASGGVTVYVNNCCLNGFMAGHQKA